MLNTCLIFWCKVVFVIWSVNDAFYRDNMVLKMNMIMITTMKKE